MSDEELRSHLADDPRSLYEIAGEAMIEPDVLYRFRDGKDIRLATAAKLAEVLGMTLTKAKNGNRRERKRA